MVGRSIFGSIPEQQLPPHNSSNMTTPSSPALEFFTTANQSDDNDASGGGISWIGRLDPSKAGIWMDSALLLVFGGIPWQVYFQRVLSAKSPGRAQIMSYAAAIGCVVLAVPPVIIGAIAKSADWTKTEIPKYPLPEGQEKMILPLVMQYLCPPWVTFIGLGAVSAAVMSSADSSVLSASSMFARNIYKLIFRQKASEREIIWVMRFGIFGVGVLAMVMGIMIDSIYELWYLCGDLVYVILFPQLVSVIYLSWTNTYGSLAGYVIGLLFRLLGGENAVKLSAVIHYPGYVPPAFNTTGDGTWSAESQRFPYKTLTMIISFSTVLIVSYVTKYIFESRILAKKWDVFQCVVNFPDEMIVLKEATEGLRLTNGIPPGAIVVPGAGGGVPPIPMPGHVKHNAPGAHINPHLKINREDLLLLPSADYQRLVESRSPSPLPEHADRLLASSRQLDQAAVVAAAAAAAAATGDQSSAESETDVVAQTPAQSATSGDDAEATDGKDSKLADKPATGDHRSSFTRKHP